MTFHESLTAFTLRSTLRLLLKPALSPRVPISIQRKWLEVLSTIARLPTGVERESTQIAGVDSMALRLNQPSPCAGGTLLYLHGGGLLCGFTSYTCRISLVVG